MVRVLAPKVETQRMALIVERKILVHSTIILKYKVVTYTLFSEHGTVIERNTKAGRNKA